MGDLHQCKAMKGQPEGKEEREKDGEIHMICHVSNLRTYYLTTKITFSYQNTP